jgi:hypothetical protein
MYKLSLVTLAAATLLTACGRAPLAVNTPASQVRAQETRLDALVGKGAFIHHAFFTPDPRHPELGTISFDITANKQGFTLDVIGFYNTAPRVLNNAVMVNLDGERLLGGTHTEDTVALLTTGSLGRQVDAKLVAKAKAWLTSKDFTQY